MVFSTVPMKPGGPAAVVSAVQAMRPRHFGSSRSCRFFGASSGLTISVLMAGVMT